MVLDVLVQAFVWFDLVQGLFVMVVGWSEVSLYSWIEFGGTVVAILFCVIWFAGWKELIDQL